MLLVNDNTNLTESGYIAEELMITDELTRKCKTVKLTVQDGDFTLVEALEVYEISKEDFLKFTAKNILSELYPAISSTDVKSGAITSVELFEILYTSLMHNVDNQLPKMVRHWKKLSKDIQSDKIPVAHFLDR
jgi:hypothetical protein